MNCQPSALKNGFHAALRERLFTPWMNVSQLQESTDRMVKRGMISLYSEFSPESGFRDLYWRPQVPFYCEVRSGRTREQFLKFHQANAERGWKLLTLHVGGRDEYFSAVWLDNAGHADALPLMEGLGIGLASVS